MMSKLTILCFEYLTFLSNQCCSSVPLGKWSSSTVSGTIPPPCSSFSFTKTDNHHVVLFGGCCSGSVRTDDVHILDLRRMVSDVMGNISS